MISRKLFSVALALGVLFSTCAVQCHAQVVGARLSGTVTDPSNAVIPNAEVSVTNISTGVASRASTDAAGFYVLPNLLPATYEATVTDAGFSTLRQGNIVLGVGAQQQLNFSMKVGESRQTVLVTQAIPTVELTSSTLRGEVDSATIRELPLNGRDWASLSTLQPGVVPVRTQVSATSPNGPRSGRGFGNAISDAGHRPNENNYRINGISVLDYANAAPGSVLGGALGVDAILEFSVLTSNYSAEYGHTTGGVISAITKSGTNSFHGGAYWFLRDEGLDARNFFDTTLPPFHRNDFGGSIGGPIIKNKTFVFFDYEGIRSGQGLSEHNFVPSPAARAGNLCSIPIASGGGACSPTTITVDPAVAPFLALYPLPNAGLIGNGDTGIFNTAANAVFVENYASARGDHRFSDKDSLAVSWFRDNGSYSQPNALVQVLSSNNILRQMGSIEETHVFSPTFVNTVRFGYNRDVGLANTPVKALVSAAADHALATFPGHYAANLAVPGLAATSALGGAAQSNFIFNSFQAYDDAFLTRGTHAIKFGFAVERQQFNGISPGNTNGRFTFPSLQGLLLNQPTQVQLQVPGSQIEYGLRQTIYAVYLQDDWRARSNLTLNFGLRYEPTTLPREANNRFQSMQSIFTGISVPVQTLWKTNASLKDFEPRIGFAWDPFRNGKTAVRGGIGIFDNLPVTWVYGGGAEASTLPFGYTVTETSLNPGSFPTGIAFSSTPNPAKAEIRYVEQNPHLAYGINWNVNVQREITPSLTAMVGGVGSHSLHQPNTPDNMDMVLPTLTSAGYLWPFPVGSGQVFNPNVGTIRGLTWAGSAHYEALQAQLTKTMSHGLQAQGAFTYGKCIDDGSGGQYGDMFGNSPSSLLWFDAASRRGLCDFNVGKNFVANFIWNAPSPKIGGPVGSSLLGGWELAGIFSASTGTPFTPLISGDPVGMKGDPTPFPDRVAGCDPINHNYRNNILGASYLNTNCFIPPVAPASFAAVCQPAAASVAAVIPNTCMNLNGNGGRNEISGPGLVNLDISVIKNTYVRRFSESFNVQFRAEMFNILNRANFQSPIDNNFVLKQDGTRVTGAGFIDGTSNPSREIQFGLKVIW